jgi:hypothetical protein
MLFGCEWIANDFKERGGTWKNAMPPAEQVDPMRRPMIA